MNRMPYYRMAHTSKQCVYVYHVELGTFYTFDNLLHASVGALYTAVHERTSLSIDSQVLFVCCHVHLLGPILCTRR
jgi:hypothetical protein